MRSCFFTDWGLNETHFVMQAAQIVHHFNIFKYLNSSRVLTFAKLSLSCLEKVDPLAVELTFWQDAEEIPADVQLSQSFESADVSRKSCDLVAADVLHRAQRQHNVTFHPLHSFHVYWRASGPTQRTTKKSTLAFLLDSDFVKLLIKSFPSFFFCHYELNVMIKKQHFTLFNTSKLRSKSHVDLK